MIHIVHDDWLFMDINGKPARYGIEESRHLLRQKGQALQVIFLDYDVRVLETVNEHVLSALNTDEPQIIQTESFTDIGHQIFSISKRRVEEIYAFYKGMNVQALIPYGVTIRAYLKQKDIGSNEKPCLILDDTTTTALITICDGMEVSSTRKITVRDSQYLCTEVSRHQKNYLGQKHHKGNGFICISNNRQWLNDLVGQGLCEPEDAVFIDDSCPALTGLKNAKFTIHFALPHQVLSQQKKHAWVSLLKIFLMVIPLVLGSFILRMMGHRQVQMMDSKLNDMHQNEQQLNEQLSKRYPEVLKHLLLKQKSFQYADIYKSLMQQLPVQDELFSYSIDSRTSLVPVVSALIYRPVQLSKQTILSLKGQWEKAQVFPVIIEDRLGYKITMKLGDYD